MQDKSEEKSNKIQGQSKHLHGSGAKCLGTLGIGVTNSWWRKLVFSRQYNMHVFCKSIICFTECYHPVKNRTNLY